MTCDLAPNTGSAREPTNNPVTKNRETQCVKLPVLNTNQGGGNNNSDKPKTRAIATKIKQHAQFKMTIKKIKKNQKIAKNHAIPFVVDDVDQVWTLDFKNFKKEIKNVIKIQETFETNKNTSKSIKNVKKIEQERSRARLLTKMRKP